MRWSNIFTVFVSSKGYVLSSISLYLYLSSKFICHGFFTRRRLLPPSLRQSNAAPFISSSLTLQSQAQGLNRDIQTTFYFIVQESVSLKNYVHLFYQSTFALCLALLLFFSYLLDLQVLNQPIRYLSRTRAMASKESAENNPGLQASQDEATKGYFLQQTVSFNSHLIFVFLILVLVAYDHIG